MKICIFLHKRSVEIAFFSKKMIKKLKLHFLKFEFCEKWVKSFLCKKWVKIEDRIRIAFWVLFHEKVSEIFFSKKSKCTLNFFNRGQKSGRIFEKRIEFLWETSFFGLQKFFRVFQKCKFFLKKVWKKHEILQFF
jgi:hypothetical protein